MLGALVALVASFSFSLSNVTVRRGVARAPVSYGAMATVVLGVPMFLLACILSGQVFRLTDLSLSSYGLLAVAGLIHYVVGRYFNYAALEAIGAARAAPINTLGLPYSVLIAFIFLGEGISLGMAVAIGLILVGPAIMVERRQPARVATVATGGGGTAPGEAEGFRLRQAEGYLFAIIAAVAYGTSPVLIRAALEGESNVSVLGGLVSYLAAATFLLGSLALPSRRDLTKALEPANLRIFFAPAFFVFMAQMLRFVALSLASVAIVAALMRFGSVFTLIMSWYMNRNLEVITIRVIFGVAITLAGAILLLVVAGA